MIASSKQLSQSEGSIHSRKQEDVRALVTHGKAWASSFIIWASRKFSHLPYRATRASRKFSHLPYRASGKKKVLFFPEVYFSVPVNRACDRLFAWDCLERDQQKQSFTMFIISFWKLSDLNWWKYEMSYAPHFFKLLNILSWVYMNMCMHCPLEFRELHTAVLLTALKILMVILTLCAEI